MSGNSFVVTIVVLSWNQSLLTENCVRSLLAVNQPGIQILVVDNNSSDNTVQALKNNFEGQITVIANKENLGFAGGNNVGIRHALDLNADHIMLLNNDTIVERNFLQPMLTTLQSDPRIGATTPKIYLMDDGKKGERIWAAGGQVNLWLGQSGSRGIGKIDTGQFDKMEEVGYASGCCILIKRETLEEVGLLNEDYFAYYEDVDWSLRARQCGYRIIYVPDSTVWHRVGSSSKNRRQPSGEGRQNPFVHYLSARNHLWFIRTYTHGLQRLTALISYFLYRILFYSVVFILLRRIKKLKELWRGFTEGLVTNPRSGLYFKNSL